MNHKWESFDRALAILRLRLLHACKTLHFIGKPSATCARAFYLCWNRDSVPSLVVFPRAFLHLLLAPIGLTIGAFHSFDYGCKSHRLRGRHCRSRYFRRAAVTKAS
jgi:hypothetical protein